MNIKHSVFLKTAWNKVTEKTIRNCFHHAKFVDQQDETPAPETSLNEDTEALFRQLSDLTPLDITHDEYIDIDSCVHTTAELSIIEIVDEIMHPDEEREEEQKDEENATQEPIITVNQARDALSKVRRFLERKGTEETVAALTLETIQEFIDDKSLIKMKQSAITNFFSRE